MSLNSGKKNPPPMIVKNRTVGMNCACAAVRCRIHTAAGTMNTSDEDAAVRKAG